MTRIKVALLVVLSFFLRCKIHKLRISMLEDVSKGLNETAFADLIQQIAYSLGEH